MLRTVTVLMETPAGSDEDKQFSSIELVISVPGVTEALLEVTVREGGRRHSWLSCDGIDMAGLCCSLLKQEIIQGYVTLALLPSLGRYHDLQAHS